jgi:hypothetical protein
MINKVLIPVTVMAWVLLLQVSAILRGVSILGSTALQAMDVIFLVSLVATVGLTIWSAISLDKIMCQARA